MPEAPTFKPRRGGAFSEADAWKAVGDGWQPLSGGFRKNGFSVEWHDFRAEEEIDWSRSFHPGSVEICLNMLGEGEVRAGGQSLRLEESNIGFYAQKAGGLRGVRRGGQRHQFLTVELSLPFLRSHGVLAAAEGLHPSVRQFGRPGARAAVSEAGRLTSEQRQILLTLRHPPVAAAPAAVWHRAKALEMAALALFEPPAGQLFCERQKWLNRERVEKVVAILRESMAEPPSLEEIGRRVGCSHFHLSRIFTQEMGKTISCHLRDLRMERAAALLRDGRLSVSQVALEVGYSSFSHFSALFHDTFGCCPGLYPLPVKGLSGR